jgi:putative zinc finger protein
MRCREVQHKLDLFVTQELTSSERERVAAHLGNCAECREALARLRRLEDVLAATPVPPVPEGFAARVVARAAEQQAVPTRQPAQPRLARSPRNRFRFTAATAAAMASGLLLGLFMGYETWRSGGPGPRGAAGQSNDLLAASGFESLVEPGGDSLAQSYLSLTMAGER